MKDIKLIKKYFTITIVLIVSIITVACKSGDTDDSKKNISKSTSIEKNNETNNENNITTKETNETNDENKTSTSETTTAIETTELSTTEIEITPSPTTEPQTTLKIEQLYKKMYVTANANVRKGPNKSEDLVGSLSFGKEVEVTGKAGQWYQINYNGTKAYIFESLLGDNKPEPQATKPQATESQTTQLQTTQPVPTQPQTTQATQNNNDDELSLYVDEVIRIVNEERAKVGLSPLVKNNDLCKVAKIRAEETVTLFDHTRPNGESCFSILRDNNISYMSAGENIAAGQRNPEAVMNSWMNSTGHRANILSGKFGQIGVGVVYGGGYGIYWVQIFTD